MAKKPLPKEAPIPPEEINLDSYHIRWKKKNWESCRPEFWVIGTPSKTYTFPVKQWEKMARMITREENDEVRERVALGQRFRQIAVEMKLPFYMLQIHYAPKKIQPSVFERIKAHAGDYNDTDRMRRLGHALIIEMETRVGTKKQREEMSSQELVSMNKMLQSTVRDTEMGKGDSDGASLTVVTQMPKKEYPKPARQKRKVMTGPLELGEQR